MSRNFARVVPFEWFGACGVPYCRECLPWYDADNREQDDNPPDWP